MFTEKDHNAWNDLSKEVEYNEKRAQKVAAIPRGIHVGSLLAPLEPHTDTIFQKSWDKTKPGNMGKYRFRFPIKRIRIIFQLIKPNNLFAAAWTSIQKRGHSEVPLQEWHLPATKSYFETGSPQKDQYPEELLLIWLNPKTRRQYKNTDEESVSSV